MDLQTPANDIELVDRFLAAWTDHQDLRRGNAEIAELWTSRQRLDALRSQLHATPRR